MSQACRWFSLLAMSLVLVFTIGCEDSEDNPVDVSVDPETEELLAIADDVSSLLTDPQGGLIAYWNLDEESMIDTSFTRDGMTYTFDHTFYDENNNGSEIYIPGETVKASRETTITGTIQTDYRDVELEHIGNLVIEGIAPTSTERIVYDYGERTVEGTVTPQESVIDVDVKLKHDWSAENINIQSNIESPYPVGDMDLLTELTKEVGTGAASADITIDITSEIQFDGTQYAYVEMEYFGGFWIDLESGQVLTEQP